MLTMNCFLQFKSSGKWAVWIPIIAFQPYLTCKSWAISLYNTRVYENLKGQYRIINDSGEEVYSTPAL